jgi:hypothetical protein
MSGKGNARGEHAPPGFMLSVGHPDRLIALWKRMYVHNQNHELSAQGPQ